MTSPNPSKSQELKLESRNAFLICVTHSKVWRGRQEQALSYENKFPKQRAGIIKANFPGYSTFQAAEDVSCPYKTDFYYYLWLTKRLNLELPTQGKSVTSHMNVCVGSHGQWKSSMVKNSRVTVENPWRSKWVKHVTVLPVMALEGPFLWSLFFSSSSSFSFIGHYYTKSIQ